VSLREIKTWLWLLLIILWCAHVTLTPEDSNTTVFSKGTPKGLKAKMPTGGHWLPSSTFTASLLWKKAQKKLKKKKISETINKIMPQRNPSSTMEVCCPIKLASRTTSRHH
jgi:hypothetical protein